ncbi:hypothetical protein NL676_012699 [Syzygium grande]|nr:hypothetical protein NL676_012699 [Syzygium grande]
MVMRHALRENMDPASGSEFSEVAIEWKANTDGGINCAPSEMSGCSNHTLELKRIRDEDWISRLQLRARNLLEIGKIEHALRSIIVLNLGIRCYRSPHPEKAPLTITCIVQHQVQFWMKRSFYAFEVKGINVNLS